MNSKLLILFLLPLSMWAQGIDVSGNVISKDDQMPLPGVSIQVEGTNEGVITDFDGNYIIENIDPQATLVYSYLGFQTKRVAVNNQTNIDVSLIMDDQQLDDVVVTGYTSQRRTDITGAVSVVEMDELNKQPEPNPIRGLQGRLPGVQITSDGSPCKYSGSNTWSWYS